MARTATSLKLRPTAINPAFLRHFSSSSSSSSSPNPNFETQNSPENSESMFADVKASLQQPLPPRQQFGRQEMPRQQFGRQEMPRQQVSVDRIKRDLGEFRLRSAAPPVNPVSFQELYKRHVASKETNPDHETNKDFTQSFSAIRDSLRQLRGNTPKPKEGGFSLSSLKDTFASRPDPRNPGLVIGSPQKFPGSEFSKNMIQNEEEDTSLAMKTAFVKMYSYKELGEKLRKLRPEGKSGGGFSLEELNERLVKLREMEERERDSKIGNEAFKDLRASLVKMKISDNKKTMKRIDFLNNFGQTSTLMLDPPKEHLVEKYFHPDNMSSAEKLKIELQKVRDEFKMSESDCGSARVQVAQLTTKIKHLATALHPKDKHSRKGLKGMIEQRKKLLKYLRRTDWDSYTLVLSKFNLKDKPDYKN